MQSGPSAEASGPESSWYSGLAGKTPDQLGWPVLVHIFGMSQPRASNLLNRHVEKFNSETLIDMLARVGVRVEVRPVSRDRYRRFNVPPRRR